MKVGVLTWEKKCCIFIVCFGIGITHLNRAARNMLEHQQKKQNKKLNQNEAKTMNIEDGR